MACPTGTICCENLNRCDYEGCNGAPTPANPGPYSVQRSTCDGAPDNSIICLSATTFNICLHNGKSIVLHTFNV